MKAFHEVRRYDSDYMVWYSGYTDISFLAHWHTELELIYVKSGSAVFGVTDRIFTARAGDLVICDSGDIHYSDPSQMENELIFLIFDPSIISSNYHYAHFSHPHIPCEHLREWGLEEPLLAMLREVDGELSSRHPYYQNVVTAALRHFWYRLLRVVPRTLVAAGHHRTRMLSDFRGLLDYMEEHCDDNLTLASCAERIGMSQSHFSRLFKKLTGINFVTYCNMLRIEKAAHELTHTNRKMTDIALSFGFQNIRTFNRVFKNLTGMTPTYFATHHGDTELDFSYMRKDRSETIESESRPATLIERIRSDR